MKCKEIGLEISAYLDNELFGPQKTIVEEHLESCSSCRDLLNSFRHQRLCIQEYKQNCQRITASPDYVRNIVSRVKSIKPQINWRRLFFPSLDEAIPFITGVVTCLIIVAWLIFGPTPQKEYYNPEPGSPNYTLNKEDVIRTGKNQSNKITLPNETVVELKENTEIIVKDKTEKKGGQEIINLKAGEIYVETHNEQRTISNEQRVKVETPAGTIIDRGTKFNVRIEPQKGGVKSINTALDVLVTVIVMEGQVLFTNNYGGQIINAGESAAAQPNSQPALLSQPHKITQPDKPNNEQDNQDDGDNEQNNDENDGD